MDGTWPSTLTDTRPPCFEVERERERERKRERVYEGGESH